LLRDRRLYFGALTALVFLAPLLFLPGRLFSAYWYVPLIGVAMMIAVLCERSPRWLVLGGLALWLAGNYALFVGKTGAILTAANDNRAYFEKLAKVAEQHPNIRAFGYDGYPAEMYVWGVEGSVHLLFGLDATVNPAPSSTNGSETCVLRWEQDAHRLVAVGHGM
jgi:hypothetical protein